MFEAAKLAQSVGVDNIVRWLQRRTQRSATTVVPGPRSVMHDSPDTMHLKAQFWTSPCGPKSSFGILEGKPNDAESRNVDGDV